MENLDTKVLKMYGGGDFFNRKFTKDGGVSIRIDPYRMAKWMTSHGAYRYKGKLMLVEKNIAKLMDDNELFRYFLNIVEDDDVKTRMIQDKQKYFTSNVVLSILPEYDGELLKDTKDASYHCYRNCIVKVTNKGLETIPYQKMDKLVLYGNIIDRDYTSQDMKTDMDKSEFFSFLSNVIMDDTLTMNEVELTNRANSITTSIGYLLHGYKDPSIVKGIIIGDVNLMNDNPEGGTGKGLIVKAIGRVVPHINIDGAKKNFEQDKFLYQDVNLSTRVIHIDDPYKRFTIDTLFSMMTTQLEVNRKFMKMITIDYKESPKFVITTNYVLRGMGGSHNRRTHEIYLSGHYSDKHQPTDEFGHLFFEGWDEEEWARFDACMMYCLYTYMVHGLVGDQLSEIKLKKLRGETCNEFVELMQDEFNEREREYLFKDVTQRLIQIYGDGFLYLNKSVRTIPKWVRLYFDHLEIDFEERKTRDGKAFYIKCDDK